MEVNVSGQGTAQRSRYGYEELLSFSVPCPG